MKSEHTLAHDDLARALRDLAVEMAEHLAMLRRRGRPPVHGAIAAMLIEPGEAEGLVGELHEFWRQRGDGAGRAPRSGAAEAFARPSDAARLPLQRLRRAFAPTPVERVAVLLAAAVEVDPRFARLVAFLNDHAARASPTLGLACALASARGEYSDPVELSRGVLVQLGILSIDADEPASASSFRLQRDILARLTGSVGIDEACAPVRHERATPPLLDGLVIQEAARGWAQRWAQAVRAREPGRPTFLRGGPGSGRRTLAHSAASLAGLGLASVDLPAEGWKPLLTALARESRWHASASLVRLSGPGTSSDRAELGVFATVLSADAVPLLLAADEATELEVRSSLPGVLGAADTVRVPEPDEAARLALWRRAIPKLNRVGDGELRALAGAYRFGPARIRSAAARAASLARERGGAAATIEAGDVRAACRDVGGAVMARLAQRLPLEHEMGRLVVPAGVLAELQLAISWVRNRSLVMDDWGLGSRIPGARGLSMLFFGPPGTGKSMAAQVMARELGVDIYRIDLSRVVSKYIGETEKNLGQLFDEAGASGAALLFDEADSLFGKRTEVRDAHDRYANLEVGYLLQRMEEFEGVAILSTNRRADLDEAFTRRFQFILEFPMPDEASRLAIWKGLLPQAAAAGACADLSRVAQEFRMSGGEIRNAVVAAAYLAALRGGPIEPTDLEAAATREIRKAGRLAPKKSN